MQKASPFFLALWFFERDNLIRRGIKGDKANKGMAISQGYP